MAPVITENSDGDIPLAIMISVMGAVATMGTLLISFSLCGCCDDKPKSDEAPRDQPAPLPPSTKSKRGSKKYDQEIKELAHRYRVSESDMQTLVDRFNAMDVNNDEAELVEAMAKLDHPITREQAAKFVHQYDRNGNGTLQLEEFLTMVTRRRKWSQPDAEKAALKAFKEFDQNNDGSISPGELCKAMSQLGDPISVEEAAEMIKMADKNKDGRISYEEFVQFWKQYTVG